LCRPDHAGNRACSSSLCCGLLANLASTVHRAEEERKPQQAEPCVAAEEEGNDRGDG